MHRYRAYGLVLVSTIPIDGLASSAGSPDFELSVARVEMLPTDDAMVLDTTPMIDQGDPRIRIERSRTDDGTYVFEFADRTRFRIEEPSRRIVADFSTSTPEDMATYLLATILPFLVRLRGDLALHAGAVALDGNALLITGTSGAGKSTTTAALLGRNATLLTDDVAVIEWRAGHPRVLPGYPRVRLWDDSAASLYGSAAALPLLTPTWSKRFVDARERFASDGVPIRAIVVLPRRHDAAPQVRRLTGHEAAMALLVRTSLTTLLTPEQRKGELEEVTRLAERIPIIEITPRDDLGATEELLEAILAAIS